MINFKLLLLNPELSGSQYTGLNFPYLVKALNTQLRLPKLTIRPFIFSCFATSVDGKICYPDLTSGYSIAKNNYCATPDERYGDWWNLLLGRTISDAVLVGSNSLINEKYSYCAGINIPDLIALRKQLDKPRHLLHIIISRSPDKIDLKHELLCQDNEIPVIIYSQMKPSFNSEIFAITPLKEVRELKHKQIIYDNDLNLIKLINLLYELGIKTILNESPYYHHELQRLGLLNEAWLNTSGVYIGGNISNLGQHNQSFSAANHPHYTILTLHTLGYNFLYTRYKINYSNFFD